MFVYEQSGSGLKPRYSHLYFRVRACFKQGVDIQATTEFRFTLKHVCDMIKTHSQLK